MTSIRESIRRLLARGASPPDPDYSYIIYWTKEARTWSRNFRQEAMTEVESLFSEPGFVANEYQRRYQLPQVDASSHSGASVLALRKVLQALLDDEQS
jgi:hypothetical protein